MFTQAYRPLAAFLFSHHCARSLSLPLLPLPLLPSLSLSLPLLCPFLSRVVVGFFSTFFHFHVTHKRLALDLIVCPTFPLRALLAWNLFIRFTSMRFGNEILLDFLSSFFIRCVCTVSWRQMAGTTPPRWRQNGWNDSAGEMRSEMCRQTMDILVAVVKFSNRWAEAFAWNDEVNKKCCLTEWVTHSCLADCRQIKI